ncbi:MAG TPA: low affinity iron permease family protein [Dehalococcoidia bacterium]|nr:low affinity iron permease family protein [Dehalococcoidia bacterium]
MKQLEPRPASMFTRLARACSRATGEPVTSAAAMAVIMLWAVTGPIFHFSDTWQLVINTATTVITFLMVFLIQNTQNQDATATQLKLDEIIRAIGGARNAMLDMEEMNQEDLDRMKVGYMKLAKHARNGKSERGPLGPSEKPRRSRRAGTSKGKRS